MPSGARVMTVGVGATAEQAAPQSVPAPTRPSRGRRFAGCVVVGYLVLGIAAFWPLLPWSSQRLFGPSQYLLIPQDATQITWFLAWVPYALAHGLNPFFSHAIFTPTGVNLAQNTAAPLLGLLTAPLAPFMGAIARANLLMVLAMPVSATAAFAVLRLWKVWGPAAAIGGLAYGFSPFAVGESLAHPFLVFCPLPPFIAYTVASILQRRGSPGRLGIATGLLLAGQYLCSQEIFTTVVLLIGWAVLCLAVRHPRRIIDVARACWRPVALATGVTVVVLAYPLWMLQFGPQRYVGTAQKVINPFHNDVLSFVAPGPLQRVGLGMRGLVPVMANPSEIGGYIGIGVLALAIVFAWRSRHSPRTQLTVAVLLGAALLSLGPRLAVGGHLTSVPLPFALLIHLPLVQNLLPSRISFEVDACLAAALAFGLDDVRHGSPRTRVVDPPARVRSALVWALVTLAVLVVTQLPQWPYSSQPVDALPAEVRLAVPPGDPDAITYPFATSVYTEPMVWQAEDGFAFRLVGGFAAHPGPDGTKTPEPNLMEPPELMEFLEEQQTHYLPYPYYAPPLVPVTSELASDTATALEQNRVRVVLVDRTAPGAAPVVQLFRRVLGQPSVATGQFVMWTTRHGPL
jgi:hypothetical protein